MAQLQNTIEYLKSKCSIVVWSGGCKKFICCNVIFFVGDIQRKSGLVAGDPPILAGSASPFFGKAWCGGNQGRV